MGRAGRLSGDHTKTVMKPLLTILFFCTWTGADLLALDMALAAEGPLPPLRLALLDFEDRAGFQAEWHLSRDVPDLLGQYLDVGHGGKGFALAAAEQILDIGLALLSPLEEADDEGLQFRPLPAIDVDIDLVDHWPSPPV